MSQTVSLNMRLTADAEVTSEVYVALFYITHDDLDAPIRLSTDPTERLSGPPDLIYGTRSTWQDSDPDTEPFLFIVASTVLPSDLEDAPAAGTLVLENLSPDIIVLLRSIISPATISMAVVLASTPDVIEAEYTDMRIMSFDADAGSITLSFSREEIESEPFPAGRFSYYRFPGLHVR